MERLRRLKSNCNWIGIGFWVWSFHQRIAFFWDLEDPVGFFVVIFFLRGGVSEGLVWVGFEVGG